METEITLILRFMKRKFKFLGKERRKEGFENVTLTGYTEVRTDRGKK